MAGNKWSLHIGIDQYPRLDRRYQLAGCVNDAELMANILQQVFGFPAANVSLLRNQEATHDAILAAFDQLVQRVSAEDIVVINYAGHGSRMRDREGQEPDGYDETIVPYDSGRGFVPNRDISDDEIYLRLLHLSEKTPYITLIFDCCHSGTISRDLFGAGARWVEPDERAIEELPPSAVEIEIAREASRDLGPSGWLPLGERYVLIAGCHSEESSYEYRVRQGNQLLTYGALTYFLGQELVKTTPGTTYRDVFERASAQVTAVKPRQHPQMEGARDRELFGVRDIEPMRFISISQRAGVRATLAAGAAHGLRVGSRWAVYPQETKQVVEGTPRLGLVEIADVRGVSAEGRIVHEAGANAIAAGSRAVEESHHYGEMRLVVEIESPNGYENAVIELHDLIGDSALLRLAESGEEADVRAYIIAPRFRARRDDPVPQLGALQEAIWAVVGDDGRLAMPVHAVAEPGVAYTLRDNLEKLVRYRQALALRNPDDAGSLRGKVEFALKRLGRGGNWVEAKPDKKSGYIIYREGERIAATITNRYHAPIYVSVLDFGLAGAVSLLYPIVGASEQLSPEASIEIGVRQGDEIELFLPDNFPYAPDPTDRAPQGGVETWKLFATSHPADFSPLVQEGFRAAELRDVQGAGTPLMQLLEIALTGHGTRDARRNRLRPDEEWTTVEKGFWVRNKG